MERIIRELFRHPRSYRTIHQPSPESPDSSRHRFELIIGGSMICTKGRPTAPGHATSSPPPPPLEKLNSITGRHMAHQLAIIARTRHPPKSITPGGYTKKTNRAYLPELSRRRRIQDVPNLHKFPDLQTVVFAAAITKRRRPAGTGGSLRGAAAERTNRSRSCIK
jgi:hypothetical protein